MNARQFLAIFAPRIDGRNSHLRAQTIADEMPHLIRNENFVLETTPSKILKVEGLALLKLRLTRALVFSRGSY